MTTGKTADKLLEVLQKPKLTPSLADKKMQHQVKNSYTIRKKNVN
jgi:hypothetical protein